MSLDRNNSAYWPKPISRNQVAMSKMLLLGPVRLALHGQCRLPVSLALRLQVAPIVPPRPAKPQPGQR
jgi:hypothetical protein